MKRYWLCPGCGTRNERVKQKCAGDGCRRSRPAARVPKHARTLRDDTYQDYCRIAAEIHDVTDESCCLCGKPKPESGRHHRDHGHDKNELAFGKPRGILCYRCNRLLTRELTDEWLEDALAYKHRVRSFYYWQEDEEAA